MLNPIKAARQNKGLSQEALADAIGVHRQSIADWETGRYVPSGSNLSKLCKVLKVKPASLIIEKPKEEEPSEEERPVDVHAT